MTHEENHQKWTLHIGQLKENKIEKLKIIFSSSFDNDDVPSSEFDEKSSIKFGIK